MTTPPFSGQTIPCPVCAGTELERLANTDRQGGHLATDLCRNCGHVFTNPQPTQSELDDYYTRHYRAEYKKVTAPKLKHVYRAGLRAMERLQRLRPYASAGASVLDVGAGGGEFVYLLTRAGFSAKGLEPNEGYAAHARTAYEIDIATGTIEGNIPDAGFWNVITLHHVLEHLADPVNVLRGLGEALAGQGVLIVEVPNVEARYHAANRRFHFAHLHNFSADTLRLAASHAGLSVADLKTQPHTGHLNAVLTRGSASSMRHTSDTAERIADAFGSESSFRDHLTLRPYRRLWANIKRPVKERLALWQLKSPKTAQETLDRLFERIVSP